MPKLFLVCGYVASGKTTVADALAKEDHLTVIRTDDLRKMIFPKEFDFVSVDLNNQGAAGMIESWIENNPEADLQQVLNPLYPLEGAYADLISKHSSEMKEQKKEVYDQAFVKLDVMLATGKDILFDAAFSSAEMRQRAYQTAVKNGADVYVIQVICDENIVASRLARRVSGEQVTSSNAREMAVFRAVKKEFDESRIQDDAPGVNFSRIVYDTGIQTMNFFGREDETVRMIKSVLSLLSRKYGGN